MFTKVIEMHFSTIIMTHHYLRGIKVLETFIWETPKNRLVQCTFCVWTVAVKLSHLLKTCMTGLLEYRPGASS